MNDDTDSVIVTVTEIRIFFPYSSLQDLCQALAEGDHTLGREATLAGYALIQWPMH